ncbi:hypothetical protein K431DRAFT_29212 [Polychaeton citri CBS 116435]|uniref:Uncharacterized protein n=1 Tax=Polychaeton citri CBS 116435 TaxID=1314669 RepID=A0A9P4QBY4_9PEZI|nr:hypothetical protein K431DRAFT_29212 [Polychaeton citri CBS 116435]
MLPLVWLSGTDGSSIGSEDGAGGGVVSMVGRSAGACSAGTTGSSKRLGSSGWGRLNASSG